MTPSRVHFCHHTDVAGDLPQRRAVPS
jgi:hypothetical protein